jgi:polypeptide N-acetylgalactosaminyltransferase
MTGIVKARLLGISHARFDIFVILDSHIEVQPQWLEPLATRIHENPKTFVMPIIDGIDTKTFDFRKSSSMCTMGNLSLKSL